jgi:hypothetical protein
MRFWKKIGFVGKISQCLEFSDFFLLRAWTHVSYGRGSIETKGYIIIQGNQAQMENFCFQTDVSFILKNFLE